MTKIYFSGLNRHGDVANNTAHWSNADKEEVNLESGLWENGQPNLNDGKCGIAKKNGKGLLGNCMRKLPFVCKTEAVLKGLLLRISYTNDRYLIRYIYLCRYILYLIFVCNSYTLGNVKSMFKK